MFKKIPYQWWLVAAGGTALIAIALVAGKYVFEFSPNILHQQDKWGQFGDYFGGVLNPILSFFAFLALLTTVNIQLKANEVANIRHADQLKEQRFVNLLDLARQNLQTTRYLSPYKDNIVLPLKGTAGTEGAWLDFSQSVLGAATWPHFESAMHRFRSMDSGFELWLTRGWPQLDAYFQSVMYLIEYIARKGGYEDGFVSFAMGVVKAQMTESERMLVFYSCLFVKKYRAHVLVMESAGFLDCIYVKDPLLEFRKSLIECAMVTHHLDLDTR